MAKKTKQDAASSMAKSPESKPAWEAFDRGDYRVARAQARALLTGDAPEAAREDARDILRRTNLEPSVKIALAALGVVIAAIIVVLATRG